MYSTAILIPETIISGLERIVWDPKAIVLKLLFLGCPEMGVSRSNLAISMVKKMASGAETFVLEPEMVIEATVLRDMSGADKQCSRFFIVL